MRIKTGKKAGKTTQELLLKEPDWAQWMAENHPDSIVSKDFRDLRQTFDGKEFTAECAGCGDTATRATAYRKTGRNIMFWCGDCNPYGSGAVQGTLTVIKTFNDALRHVDSTCNGVRSEKRAIIRGLAEGKGLPRRVGEAQATAFFDT
jgi:hypothetical protein